MEQLAQGVAIAAVVATTGYILWRTLLRPQVAVFRALRHLPRRKVAQLVAGERAYVVGRARAKELTTASQSKRPCILYRTRLTSNQLADGDPGATMGNDFEVEDATGRILAASSGLADADLDETYSEPLREGPHETSWLTYLHEGILVDGDRVAVGGLVERAGDGTLRIVGTAEAPLLIMQANDAAKAK